MPRTLTNRFNLPMPFVHAVSHDTYSKGKSDYSTTGLLKPARISELLRQHKDHIQEDVSDLAFRLAGSAKHVVLERAANFKPDLYLAEHRLFMEIAGKCISGQIDLLDRETRILYDYKETSIWRVLLNDTTEWEAQGNINALLCKRNGIEVKQLVNIVYMKDWKQREADNKAEYPQCAIHSCRLSMWPDEETEHFIEQRIAAHEAAKTVLPMCSMEERWQKPDRWALMAKGRKRAIKLYDTKEQAEAAVTDAKAQFVEPRPGEPIRCLHFCPVSQFCSFARDYIMEHKHL